MNNPVIIISKLDARSISLAAQIAESGSTPDMVLMSEAVYMLKQRGDYFREIITAIKQGARFYAISEDITKRGIAELVEHVTLIGYGDLVDLLMESPRATINL